MMTVRDRINRCRLIEKIKKQDDYSKKIGIENISKFKGVKVNDIPQNNG